MNTNKTISGELRKKERHSEMRKFQTKIIYSELWRCCPTCENMDTTNGKCRLAGKVPPMDIVIFGCEEYVCDDIPF